MINDCFTILVSFLSYINMNFYFLSGFLNLIIISIAVVLFLLIFPLIWGYYKIIYLLATLGLCCCIDFSLVMAREEHSPVGSREWRCRSCSSCALVQGFSSCGAPGLSCSVTWGSSWTRDQTHYLLLWQVDSLLLSHQGNHSYYICFIMFRKHSTDSSPKFSCFGISSGISIVYAFIYLIFSCQSLPFFFFRYFFSTL